MVVKVKVEPLVTVPSVGSELETETNTDAVGWVFRCTPKESVVPASVWKLFASEAAWRCADRVVQVFGGRGYMREFAPERFLRELRVDRIWEGTSEIQRMIIARALERRGVGRVVG